MPPTISKGAPQPMRKPAVRFSAALLALLLAPLAAGPATAAVILSELCDPYLNYTTDRFIEIYNTGPGAVDLTGWKIVAVGNSVDVNTWTLSGTIGPGEAKVAGSTAPVTVFPIHFAERVVAHQLHQLERQGRRRRQAGEREQRRARLRARAGRAVREPGPGAQLPDDHRARPRSSTRTEWTRDVGDPGDRRDARLAQRLDAAGRRPADHEHRHRSGDARRSANPVDVQASVVDTSGAIRP